MEQTEQYKIAVEELQGKMESNGHVKGVAGIAAIVARMVMAGERIALTKLCNEQAEEITELKQRVERLEESLSKKD